MSAPDLLSLPAMWRNPIAQGWCVFPVKARDKAPLGKWSQWQHEKPDPATVAQWARTPSNVGIVTGAISGLVVLDLDTYEAKRIAEERNGGPFQTVIAKTGKGEHVYFKHPGGVIGNRTELFPGADLRGDGGFVVGPGSTHKNGGQYEWINPPGLFELAQMPQWLIDALSQPAKGEPAKGEPIRHDSSGNDPYCIAALEGECEAIRKAPNGAQESTLNKAALKVGHYVGGGGLCHQTALQALLSAALAMPSYDSRNPWTRDLLARKIERALADGMAEPKAVPDRITPADFDSFDPVTGEIMDEKPAKPVKAFRFVQVGELQYRPPEYLVHKLIETETLGLIFGDPGCGKSFLAVDIALCVATGAPFHGQAVKQGPVFFLAGEGHNGLTRRFAAWGKARGVPITDAPLFVSNKPAQFLDGDSAREVAEAVNELAASYGKPALIVIDTLARNFGPGDENSTKEMGQFIAAIDDLKAQFPGCVALIIHHSGHADKQRARGAMALKGALDCEYRVGKHENTIKLFNTKMKDAPDPGVMAFTLEGVELDNGASSAVLVETEHNAGAKPLTKTQKLALDAFCEAAAESDQFDDEGQFLGLSLEPWREVFYKWHTGDTPAAKRQAFGRARKDLVELGRLTVENDIYRPTDFVETLDIGLRRKSVTSVTQRDNVTECHGAEGGESVTSVTHA